MEDKNTISISHVSKSFNGIPVLTDFSHLFKQGKIYCLTGENGSGKTTLLKIIAGIEKPDVGKISIYKTCSVAFQEHRLFYHLSALSNISIVCNDKKKAKGLLSYFGFSESDMKKKPAMLSGGMKQIVSICRALSYNYDVLLLDEASKELSVPAKEKFHSALAELKKNKIILMISHDEDDVRFADEIIMLNKPTSYITEHNQP